MTFSCYRRLPLLSNDRIKDALMERLAHVKTSMGFKLYAWVFMPEHVHLLLQTASSKSTVKEILNALKARFAQQVIERWRELKAPILDSITDAKGQARFWQSGGGYDRNIVSDQECLEKINYIHDNPVRRKLAGSPTQWRWSSARWYAEDRAERPAIDPLW